MAHETCHVTAVAWDGTVAGVKCPVDNRLAYMANGEACAAPARCPEQGRGPSGFSATASKDPASKDAQSKQRPERISVMALIGPGYAGGAAGFTGCRSKTSTMSTEVVTINTDFTVENNLSKNLSERRWLCQ